MDRKEFLNTGIIFGAAAISKGCTPLVKDELPVPVPDYLAEIPISCSHEHWGSLTPIGFVDAGFVADLKPGALPDRRTTMADLLIDPYMAGSLAGNGLKLRQNLEPGEEFRELSEILQDLRVKGTYQALRLGILFAYNYDLQSFDQEQFINASRMIGEQYGNLFSWYRKLMSKAGLTNLIRPVQPEFYFADFKTGPALEELSFTSTLLRIDPFLDFWKTSHPRRDFLAEKLGIDPVDGPSWRSFLEKMFSHAADRDCLGIKQLQAYTRSLDFEEVKESGVRFRGDLSGQEVKRFQDWLMHILCELANHRKWPHQIHVGTHNHPHSNPLPLQKLASRYPNQKIIMLHCWPYLDEAGFLAQAHPNVYIDTCWQPILNPDFLRKSMDTWLGYIPLSKWTMSNDSTSVEMATGASMISRRVLGEALSKKQKQSGISDAELREIAAQLLNNNAVGIYGIGSYYPL